MRQIEQETCFFLFKSSNPDLSLAMIVSSQEIFLILNHCNVERVSKVLGTILKYYANKSLMFQIVSRFLRSLERVSVIYPFALMKFISFCIGKSFPVSPIVYREKEISLRLS